MKCSANRRQFLGACAAATLVPGTSLGNAWTSRRAGFEEAQDDKMSLYDPSEWGVEGRGFDDTASYYNRLPARAEQSVRKTVWNLSQQSAGMSVRFKTDAPAIFVSYDLTSSRLAIPHMPATSVSGVDLYAIDDEGSWRWVSVLKPSAAGVNSNLVNNLVKPRSGLREFMLYLPLYNGIKDLRLRVSSDAKFEGVPPRTEKPIVFYGTSIMHGACASRSGMSIPAILGRRLNRPTINLGFSGNGRMEKEVGDYLCELDPCVFAIDCLPNMNAKAVTEKCEPLVQQLKSARPETPILLVEDRVNTGAWIRKGALERHAANRAALWAAFESLKSQGVKNLYYLKSADLLGADGEAATDGSHPSDLGMVRYADAYEKAFGMFLK